jgi:hypothetical protein
MINKDLLHLAAEYPSRNSAELIALAKNYEYRRDREILDLAAIAADVSTDSLLNLQLEPENNEELWKAFSLFTHKDPVELRNLSSVEIEPYVNGVKGKYFEVLVAKRLNDGKPLGDVGPLLSGQKAVLADSPTQPGWDLKIINQSDESLVEELQLKATSSLAYVKEALERYPDIQIATTLEIDTAAENILRTNISNEGLEQTAREQLFDASEAFYTDLADKTAEWAFDALPIFPAVVIAVTEGRALLTGRASMEDALQRGAERLQDSAIFTTLGATLTAMDAGVISVPTTVAARIGWRRVVNRIAMTDFLKAKTEAVLLLAH